MSDIQQVHDDLHFVREILNRRSPGKHGFAIPYYLSAVYVLIGYILLDFRPEYANRFFIIGAVLEAAVLFIYFARLRPQTGQIDRARAQQNTLHWAFGIGGSILATFALATVVPALRGPAVGQIMLVLIGMVYFMWGVYRDRAFLLLGPLLMAGAIAVGFIPRFPWTCLGVIIALALVCAGMMAQQSVPRPAPSVPPAAND